MSRYFQYLPYCIKTCYVVFMQKLLCYKSLHGIYRPYYANPKGLLTHRLLKRSYYLSTWYPLMYANTYATLSGKPLTYKEKKAAIYASAIAVLFDAIFDDLDFNISLLFSMIKDPQGYKPVSDVDELIMKLYRKLMEYLPARHKELFRKYVHEVFYAQKDSLKQKDALSELEIETITYRKGGYSALLFRTLLDRPLVNNEEEAIYNMGGFFQFLNDVTNIQSDLRKNIVTLATFCPAVSNVESKFTTAQHKLILQVRRLGYPRKNIEKVVFKLHFLRAWALAHLNGFNRCSAQGQLTGAFKWTLQDFWFVVQLVFQKEEEVTSLPAAAPVADTTKIPV